MAIYIFKDMLTQMIIFVASSKTVIMSLTLGHLSMYYIVYRMHLIYCFGYVLLL